MGSRGFVLQREIKGLVCVATWRSKGKALKFSNLVSRDKICYLAICCIFEMHWIHYLAMTMK